MKKIIFIINFIIISMVSYSLNFSVAPTKFQVDLSKVATQEAYVINNTTQPMRIETYLENDENFGENFTMIDDIVVFPKKIAIKAGGTQVVRFRVKPRQDMPEGELKTYITFKEVPQEIKNTNSTEKKGEMMGAGVGLLTEISVPIYGYKGEQIVKGELKNIVIKSKGNNIGVFADSESFGNTSMKLSFEITPLKSGEPINGSLGISAREGKKKISVAVTVPKEFVGQKVRIVIKDQTDKVYYNGEKQL